MLAAAAAQGRPNEYGPHQTKDLQAEREWGRKRRLLYSSRRPDGLQVMALLQAMLGVFRAYLVSQEVV
jgi:hypothetical protein